MKIINATVTVPSSDKRSWLERVSTALSAHLKAGRYPLRAAIASVNAREAVIESTFVELDPKEPYREQLAHVELASARRKDHQDSRFAVVQIVPTGVRCEIGGFVGDACPATNLLASAADVLITPRTP